MDLGFLFLSELLGTLVLVAMGTSVNAAVNMKRSYAYSSQNNGWILVTIGWGLAIMAGAAVASYSGGSINPAVALSRWIYGTYSAAEMSVAFAGEIVGAILGALLTTFLFIGHFQKHFAYKGEHSETKFIDSNKESLSREIRIAKKSDYELDSNEKNDYDTLRGIFVTGPSITECDLTSKSVIFSSSFVTEAFGTFLLIAGLFIPTAVFGTIPFTFVPIYAGLLVIGIGLTIGGLTGFALNPARDLGPRIVYQLLPFKDKKSADWSYGWVPIVAPFVGASIAVGFALLFK